MKSEIRYRLPKKMILRGRKQFETLFSQGQGFRSGEMVFKYRVVASTGLPGLVVAFIVPKKHGRAVDRNRLRRLMREAWRLEYSGFLSQLNPEGVVHIALIWAGRPARVATPNMTAVRENIIKGMQKMAARIQGSSSKTR